MTDDMTISITLKELEALEALVYAARCQKDGHKSWITVEQAINNLDKIRNIDPDENQGMFFDKAVGSTNSSEVNWDRLNNELDKLTHMMENLARKIERISKDLLDQVNPFNDKNSWRNNDFDSWRDRITNNWNKPL